MKTPAQQTAAAVPNANVDGQVNRLMIDNKGDKAILVLAGTLVKGGKQDRVIAQDFIIPPKQTVPVDAFCVEQGRWVASRGGQANDGTFASQNALANSPVRAAANFEADQSKVWDKVAKENA